MFVDLKNLSFWIALVVVSAGSLSVSEAQNTEDARVYPVQHGPAGELAPRVRQLLAHANVQAEVVIDRSRNRLIVRGGADAQRIVGQSISALDVRPQASTVKDSPTLRATKVPEGSLHEVAQSMGLKYRNHQSVRITPDEPTGQLLVLAPEELQQEIQQDIDAMISNRPDIQQVTATMGRPVRAEFKLRNASWRQFEDSLAKLAGRRLPVTTARNGELATFNLVSHQTGSTSIQVDRRNNNVLIVASKESINGWQRVMETIDHQEQQPGQATQIIRVEKAQPAPIRRAVKLLQEIRPVVAQEDDTIGVAPGAQNNPLLKAVLQRRAADAAQGEGGAAEAGTDQDPFSGLFGDVQIEFVPELGVIIVRGAKRDVDRVMEVINQIEEKSGVTQPKVEVISLEHANSVAVAEIVIQLYEEILAPRQGQVSITALDKPNAILLIGREEAIAGVIDLIKKVDQPVVPTSEFKVFKLEHASAIDVQSTIQGFFVNQPGSDDEQRPGLGTRVRIIADYRTNSIIAQASPRDLNEVERMIEELDVASTGATSEIKVFQLKNAFAEDLQPILQEAISGQPEDTPEDTNIPSTTLSILSVDADGNKTLDSGILSGVVVTADPNVNALVVRAPAKSMALIGELIQQLDRLPDAESVVKVFTIVNGDATQLATSLQELFALDGQGTTGGNAPANANLAALNLTSGAETSLVPLRFAVDIRTNSIIASGSETDLEVVESLLIRLDTEGFSSRVTETIWLRNAAAADVSAALLDFVQQQGQLQSQNQFFSQNLGPYDLPERDLIVAPEPRTNSLVISVSPRLYPDVRRIIDQLDRRPPMIMIQVLLAEVFLGDGIEIGAELGLQDSILFDRSLAAVPATTAQNPGFNFIPNTDVISPNLPNENAASSSDVAGQAATAFAMGVANAERFGYGGFVLSAASESVNLLLRALQEADRAQILSRPQIMTLDGTEGFVTVGDLFPRITSVNQTGNVNGTIVVQTEDINIGLILRVTPRVGQDGLIVMDVDAQRSRVDPDEQNGQVITTDQNGVPIVSRAINITQAQSTVTAMDGQTVVFGGLITKDRFQNSRRVPYLSNIPILGHLFRYDFETEERREMLIVLTPRIVDDEEDVRLINEAETSRMSYCLADAVEMHGTSALGGGYGLWGPAVGAMIYPDEQPTIDDIRGPGVIYNQERIVPGSIRNVPMSETQNQMPLPQPVPAAPAVPEPAAVPLAPPIEDAGMLNQSPAPGIIGSAAPVGYAPQPQPVGTPQRIPVEAFGNPGQRSAIAGPTIPVGYNSQDVSSGNPPYLPATAAALPINQAAEQSIPPYAMPATTNNESGFKMPQLR